MIYNKIEYFKTNVLEIKSLKVGDVLEGIVRNHASFGIFIDIGIGFNALAHSSTLSSILPEVGIFLLVEIIQLHGLAVSFKFIFNQVISAN